MLIYAMLHWPTRPYWWANHNGKSILIVSMYKPQCRQQTISVTLSICYSGFLVFPLFNWSVTFHGTNIARFMFDVCATVFTERPMPHLTPASQKASPPVKQRTLLYILDDACECFTGSRSQDIVIIIWNDSFIDAHNDRVNNYVYVQALYWQQTFPCL